jgi:hypothetical protein
MWMGGVPPLGYRAEDGKLIIVESEAETVRFIFRRLISSPVRGNAAMQEANFVADSLLEGRGFEPSVPPG